MSLQSQIVYGQTLAPEQASKARKVVETLGHLALAIAQAGAYIQETSCSLYDYLAIYRNRRRDLLAYLSDPLGTDYRYSVYAT